MTKRQVAQPGAEPDGDLLPPADVCNYNNHCGEPAANHQQPDEEWQAYLNRTDARGPMHAFVVPPRQPHPSRIVEAHIETQWTCWSCGEDQDVWGVGAGWIECRKCGAENYLR